jgi:hypothetical protein
MAFFDGHFRALLVIHTIVVCVLLGVAGKVFVHQYGFAELPTLELGDMTRRDKVMVVLCVLGAAMPVVVLALILLLS